MTYRVVGISFDHMHMGDLLRMVDAHPEAQIAGLFDPDRAKMQGAIDTFKVPDDRVFTDFDACMEAGPYDLAILCCATADHADMTERLAPHGVHIHVEKPFAASADDARRMMRAMEGTGKIMAINWPLAWVESHLTAKRLIDEGMIGELREVHFYDGNRGPLYHLADKVEVSPEEVERQKPDSWWYKRASGGGSLLDYMGYGATLGTWYMGGEAPLEVTCTVDETPGIEVDQHAIAVVRYAKGLSKMETRWGTFTDPWTTQPQPTCGFVIVGSDGTIASPDYAQSVTVQTRARPERHEIAVDPLPEGRGNPIEYILGCIADGRAPEGPLDPALCLIAQRIVDTAALSAREKRTMELLP
ncbi:Gfo/Idh/MocA family protein [Hasllibacter sp. MH4015]|uniref:Gfo/Idh/MocA family protein n=1 Tax=Hasllibacter sp. MH4015 TaxID=2854029 RepID=UPI001CD27422|nr:Gfo/Idh/MocA family oxidoreductase [Hasllibacter sp. MH4015]